MPRSRTTEHRWAVVAAALLATTCSVVAACDGDDGDAELEAWCADYQHFVELVIEAGSLEQSDPSFPALAAELQAAADEALTGDVPDEVRADLEITRTANGADAPIEQPDDAMRDAQRRVFTFVLDNCELPDDLAAEMRQGL